MGGCISTKKQGQPKNSENKIPERSGASTSTADKKPNTLIKANVQYTTDKYGKLVPVLGEVENSKIMIRRGGSKENL